MYVDFEYYSSVFSGSVLSEGAFQKAEQEAETYIRYLTYLNGDIFADTAQADAIKGAVCAAADAYHMAVRETADDYVKRCMYQVIRIRLLPTGWLSRKAGCKHDHKCGCCDCL